MPYSMCWCSGGRHRHRPDNWNRPCPKEPVPKTSANPIPPKGGAS